MAHPAVASGEIMRVLAHELRQPLSTIESIAYYLTLILPEDEKIREQLDRIQQLVEQSNWMLTSGQLLSEPIPAERPRTHPNDLFEHTQLTGLQVQVEEALPPVHGDPVLLRTIIENVAMLLRQISPEVAFRAARADRGLLLEWMAAATGHRSEGSLGVGSSLSLQGARRMVEALGGSFHLEIDPVAGIKLRVMLT